MLRVLARIMPLIVGLCMALLLLMHVPPVDDSELQRFFAASCTALPCWQGIRPGETTVAQALTILRAHPWVQTVSEVYTSPYEGSTNTILLYWTWSSRYPFAASNSTPQQGIIITDQRIVRQIYLTTNLRLGDLWLALGDPQGGMVDYVFDTQRLRVDNTALFAHSGIAATASLVTRCDNADYPDFWRIPVYLWLQSSASLESSSVADPHYLRTLRAGYQQARASSC